MSNLLQNTSRKMQEFYLESFNKCKEMLSNASILIYSHFNKPFTLTTDVSNVTLGSALSQSNKPIAFHSRTLNSAEQNYSIEIELLSLVTFTKHFRPYLYGRKFTVETDHKPLIWLNGLKELNSRLLKCKLRLGEVNYVYQIH